LKATLSQRKHYVRYESSVSRTDSAKKNSKKYTSKKNQLALKDQATGNYTAKYRVVVRERKTGKIAFRTRFSPNASYTVSGS
jgi:hypothetical protein